GGATKAGPVGPPCCPPPPSGRGASAPSPPRRTKARTLCPLASRNSVRLRPMPPTAPAAPVTRIGLSYLCCVIMLLTSGYVQQTNWRDAMARRQSGPPITKHCIGGVTIISLAPPRRSALPLVHRLECSRHCGPPPSVVLGCPLNRATSGKTLIDRHVIITRRVTNALVYRSIFLQLLTAAYGTKQSTSVPQQICQL